MGSKVLLAVNPGQQMVKIVQDDQLLRLRELFDLGMGGEVAHWKLESSGQWLRQTKSKDGEPLKDMQNEIMARTLLKKRSV